MNRKLGTAARLLIGTGIVLMILGLSGAPFPVQAVAIAAFPPAWAYVIRGLIWPFLAWWAISAVNGILIASLVWDPAQLAGSSASLVIAALVWWWRRRKDRYRSLARWGARELARLRSMVATLRERSKPRPVLRPGRVPV